MDRPAGCVTANEGGFLVKAVSVLLPTLALLLTIGLASGSRAEPCEGCFFFNDTATTEIYTHVSMQPRGAAHLDLITRWICAHRSAWVEPSTGKEMPIVMAIQLGDLVQSGDVDEGANGTLDEWERVDAAFDNLDACPGGGSVPYLVTLGNHDLASGNHYAAPSAGYDQFFGPSRWAPYQCSDPSDCDWAAGEWFIGGGDTIVADSRNNADGAPGPPADQPGRHRAAVIRTPDGQRMLFLGIEAGFDFPPPAHPAEGDDVAWLRGVLADYPGVHTVLFHHALIGPLGGFVTDEAGGSAFGSDSIVSTQDIWDRVGAPDDQTLMTFNGHWIGYIDAETGGFVKARAYDELLQTNGGLDVFAFFRNYQGEHSQDGQGVNCQPFYGGGWNVIAAFDPSAGEIRVRSYRIEDVDNDCTHDGVPASAADLQTDKYLPETTLSYAFPDTRPASLDNCPGVDNPDQSDADGDGFGDICDSFPNDPDNNLAQCSSDLGDCHISLIGCEGDVVECDASRASLETDLMEARATIAALEEDLADEDTDGVLDSVDACPDTPSSAAVDGAGCSLSQFCEHIDVSNPLDAPVCRRSDWRNDEPLEAEPGNCAVHDDRCVAAPEPSSSAMGMVGFAAVALISRRPRPCF
jgi:hypothetical protein